MSGTSAVASAEASTPRRSGRSGNQSVQEPSTEEEAALRPDKRRRLMTPPRRPRQHPMETPPMRLLNSVPLPPRGFSRRVAYVGA